MVVMIVMIVMIVISMIVNTSMKSYEYWWLMIVKDYCIGNISDNYNYDTCDSHDNDNDNDNDYDS